MRTVLNDTFESMVEAKTGYKPAWRNGRYTLSSHQTLWEGFCMAYAPLEFQVDGPFVKEEKVGYIAIIGFGRVLARVDCRDYARNDVASMRLSGLQIVRGLNLLTARGTLNPESFVPEGML